VEEGDFSEPGGKYYRGTFLIRKRHPIGPYSRPVPRALWWSWGGGPFLMSEVPLYYTSSPSDKLPRVAGGNPYTIINLNNHYPTP